MVWHQEVFAPDKIAVIRGPVRFRIVHPCGRYKLSLKPKNNKNLIFACILLFIGIAPTFRSEAQTVQRQSAEPFTNTYSLDPHDIRDETWQEYELHVYALLHHAIIPELLPASKDTNDLVVYLPTTFGDPQQTASSSRCAFEDKNMVPAMSCPQFRFSEIWKDVPKNYCSQILNVSI